MRAAMGGDGWPCLMKRTGSQNTELKGLPLLSLVLVLMPVLVPVLVPVLHLSADLCRQKRPAVAQSAAAAVGPAEGPCRHTWHSLTLCSCYTAFLYYTGFCAACKERRICVGLCDVLAYKCVVGRTVAPNDETATGVGGSGSRSLEAVVAKNVQPKCPNPQNTNKTKMPDIHCRSSPPSFWLHRVVIPRCAR